MFEVMRGWVDRYLSDEEAVLLAVILGLSFVVIITMGDILAPLLIAIVLAYILQGIVKFLHFYRVPDLVAIGLTFILFLGGSIAVLFVIIPKVWKQMRTLYEELPDMITRTQELLAALPENYPSLVSEQQVASWIDMLGNEAGQFGQWLLSFSLSQLPMLIAVVVYILLVPILVFFLLKDREKLLSWSLSFLPEERPLMDRIGAEMNVQMANYVRGKFVEILIVGIVSYVVFKIFGLNYAALLAVLVGLSVIVPYLGLIAVTIPVVIIAYLQFGWTPAFFYVVMWYSIIQAIDGLVLVPLLFSEAVNLHPIAIIVAVLIFGSWWGLWGVFFAIPLATLVKAIITAWPKGARQVAAET
ncbi:MAG: AI-2E family transporter [Pseudomonadales bacterium]|nr:AI-2E family transporter [Pseudomonadales bacterium]